LRFPAQIKNGFVIMNARSDSVKFYNILNIIAGNAANHTSSFLSLASKPSPRARASFEKKKQKADTKRNN